MKRIAAPETDQHVAFFLLPTFCNCLLRIGMTATETDGCRFGLRGLFPCRLRCVRPIRHFGIARRMEKMSRHSRRHRDDGFIALASRFLLVLHRTNRFGVGTQLHVAEIVNVVVNGLADAVDFLIADFLFVDRIARQVNRNLVAGVNADQFAVFSVSFKASPQDKVHFIARHPVDRQPETVAVHPVFPVFHQSSIKRFLVEFVLGYRFDSFKPVVETDDLPVVRVVDENRQMTVDDGRFLHFLVAEENDFALVTADGSLFFREHSRLPDAGHACSPLRLVPVKRIRKGERFLLRTGLRTPAAGHGSDHDEQPNNDQSHQQHHVFAAPFTAVSFEKMISNVQWCSHGRFRFKFVGNNWR